MERKLSQTFRIYFPVSTFLVILLNEWIAYNVFRNYLVKTQIFRFFYYYFLKGAPRESISDNLEYFYFNLALIFVCLLKCMYKSPIRNPIQRQHGIKKVLYKVTCLWGKK